MSNNKQTQITIDDVSYDVEAFTAQQKMFLEHCMDLERKIGSCRFQLDQLTVGKDSFLKLLKASLADQPAEAVEVVQ
jgi:hypothetical protein